MKHLFVGAAIAMIMWLALCFAEGLYNYLPVQLTALLKRSSLMHAEENPSETNTQTHADQSDDR